ncbi:hypothetical protein F5B21DRAFT_490401 [Xylaria acuta]|nr:hypothetical protein F5B21DRAFT_490401 [Xylaria acuta]
MMYICLWLALVPSRGVVFPVKPFGFCYMLGPNSLGAAGFIFGMVTLDGPAVMPYSFVRSIALDSGRNGYGRSVGRRVKFDEVVMQSTGPGRICRTAHYPQQR